ncbi:uncharacterized protein LOC9643524 [Selaginella moellendorffii]|uniref:uncharacterized protein LOC9643524 n=1 Tax=Selaginella moellendorffii TaxID=88036 RepID=UPI000D1C4958|nr:uncharacterized protein LOC9643524 [Selaginella moellendorffii]|eukprot:XP_024524238.1 uncharacterized protein LOC9643524 [Selaginella moellendorffii]
MEGEKKKRVVLVTGASSGLGKEFAIAFAQQGSYRVVLAARRTHLLESVCEEIGHHDARSVELDVSASEKFIDAGVDRAWNCFGGVDVLVNNAGIRGPVKSPLELDEDDWNKTFNTNTRGTWLVSKAVARRMVAAKKPGSIINISSTASSGGLLPGGIAYASSKAAINRLTQSMALELGKFKIRVNAIAAGIFPSEITDSLLDKAWVHDAAAKIVPLRRFGQVSPDLTSLVLMLASDEHSSYITGQIYHVDGGHTLPGIQLWSSL